MLTVVGLGPGNPKLVTVAALEALRRADVVYIPVSGKGGEYAGEILKYWGIEHERLVFPMNNRAEDYVKKNAELLSSLSERAEVAFALLGDPSLYSTFGKLYPHLRTQYRVIPGVAAFSACASLAGVPIAVDAKSLCIKYKHNSRCDADVVVVYNGSNAFSDVGVDGAARVLYGRRCGMENGYVEFSKGPYQGDYWSLLVIWRK